MALHIYRNFSDSVPSGAASITVRDPNATWRQVAAAGPGSAIYNDIVRWAQTIKARGSRVMVAYHHEAEASTSQKFGSSADFVAAFRRVVSIFRAQGATNVEWTWQATPWAFKVNSSDRRYAAKWYPGDAYVDNIGIDGYNWSNCYGHSTWSSMAAFTDPVIAFARARGKHVSLQEFGAAPDSRRAQWLVDSHRYLTQNKGIVTAAFYFQNGAAGSRCAWRLTTSSEFRAYGDTARDTTSFRSS
jgi:beta-mannanase